MGSSVMMLIILVAVLIFVLMFLGIGTLIAVAFFQDLVVAGVLVVIGLFLLFKKPLPTQANYIVCAIVFGLALLVFMGVI
jgi:hypothetical protein